MRKHLVAIVLQSAAEFVKSLTVSSVALVAFSETDREAFQTVFEQFVEVFSERDSVQRIVRRATDFGGFLDELVAVIDG